MLQQLDIHTVMNVTTMFYYDYQVMSRIRSLVQSKLDKDTLYFLQEPEKHVDTDTHNLRVEASLSDHHVTYCLWGNVIKNPRLAI